MRIVITDENVIWTADHPALEPFSEIVYVVCLNGHKITDKYRCFVSDYKPMGLGMTDYGKDSVRYHGLETVAHMLNEELGYHEDIVFLTDGEPASLYPFHAIQTVNEWNYLHLVTMSPWVFESTRRRKAHEVLLGDLFSVDSFLLYDCSRLLWEMKKSTTLPDLIKVAKRQLGDLLPDILYQIQERDWQKAYFDFHTMKYLPIEEGGTLTNQPIEQKHIDISMINADYSWSTMGEVLPDCYPNRDEEILQSVESPVPRADGKQVCDYLRKLRVQLAKVNGIPFESEECPSEGPCAGTCEKCDAESAYLRDEMDKIAVEKRIYPQEPLEKWGKSICIPTFLK